MALGGQVRPAAASDAAEVARIYVGPWDEGSGYLLSRREPPPADGERWTGKVTSTPAR